MDTHAQILKSELKHNDNCYSTIKLCE